MALIDDIRIICDRLAPLGWADLFQHHGLDITAADLEAELSRNLNGIDRTAPGLEDFSSAGDRGVEPGDPSRSLLYHALASPNVVRTASGIQIDDYPTLAELQTVENYVFASSRMTFDQIRNLVNGDELGVVVFAREYRPASHTCHRLHADMVFSRTGVARVGTAGAVYHPRIRGFIPLDDADPLAIRVLPAQYAVYLAVSRNGNAAESLPMRSFRERNNPNPSDPNRDFWVPVHKLFDGDECISGLNLTLDLSANHVNEKLAKVHEHFARLGIDGGHAGADLSQPPFTLRDGLAELAADPSLGMGVVVPVPNPLVKEATLDNGRLFAFEVPPSGNGVSTFSSSLELSATDGVRHAPEYVHARLMVNADESVVDLNQFPDVEDRVAQGNYRALHFWDFSAEGVVEARCNGLPGNLDAMPAYSLVASPDFFTRCDQRELTEWTAKLRRQGLSVPIWLQPPPNALSDERLPPNPQLQRSNGSPAFSLTEDTATAIVGLHGRTHANQSVGIPLDVSRHSHLPDDAAGIFAPGWDISHDATDQGEVFLSSYGLGSPFPEDAKLCAALSTFWPAVAPDVSRTFGNAFGPSVAPLTDEEMGIGSGMPWDGIAPPVRVQVGAQAMADVPTIQHADYVDSALSRQMTLFLTSVIDAEDYQERVIRMLNAYAALGVNLSAGRGPREAWIVHSFKLVSSQDAELAVARSTAGGMPVGKVYRFEMYRAGIPQPGLSVDRIRIPMRNQTTLFVDERQVWRQAQGAGWLRTTAAVLI